MRLENRYSHHQKKNHPPETRTRPGGMGKAELQWFCLSGQAINDSADPEENVRDAQTNDDRNKHHDVFKLIHC